MLPFIVPVDSHALDRARPKAAEPVTDAGAVWGRPAALALDAETEAEEARGGGMTLVMPQEHIYTSETVDMSPVWRRFDIVEISAIDEPGVTMRVVVTRELLFPLRSERMAYVGGGSYVLDPEGQPFEDREVHTFLHLVLPDPAPRGGRIIERGLTEGEWPRLPEEMFTPGGVR